MAHRIKYEEMSAQELDKVLIYERAQLNSITNSVIKAQEELDAAQRGFDQVKRDHYYKLDRIKHLQSLYDKALLVGEL